MSRQLTLFGCPNSRSLRAAWGLEEAGADYAYHRVDLFRGEGRQAPLSELNPAGKVPVLLTAEGAAISESGAILLWIAERYPDSGLLPSPRQAGRRARCLQWAMFVLTELEQPLWTIAKHRFVLPAEWRVAAIEPSARWEYERAAALLAEGLGAGRTLLGDDFSLADILACHTLLWARSARIGAPSGRLDEYLQRHVDRPAFARAVAREGQLPRSTP